MVVIGVVMAVVLYLRYSYSQGTLVTIDTVRCSATAENVASGVALQGICRASIQIMSCASCGRCSSCWTKKALVLV